MGLFLCIQVSAARRLARSEGASKSQARCDGFPNGEHNGVRRSVNQIHRGPHRFSRSVRTVEAEQYGTTLVPSRHDMCPFLFSRSRTLPRLAIQESPTIESRT